jgi:P27 family predicted phage terminase small subunit
VPELQQMGLFTVVDRAVLAGYCQAWARWKEAEEMLSKGGSIFKSPKGHVQQLPHVSIARYNLMLMKALAAEFGFSPSSRSQITSGRTSTEEDEFNRRFGPRPS